MTQNERILERLKTTPNKWIPMPELAEIGSGKRFGFCMVHSRISELREKGHVIEHSQERIDGQTHSFYRIIEKSKVLM